MQDIPILGILFILFQMDVRNDRRIGLKMAGSFLAGGILASQH